jgi:hypothetical protein
VGPRASLYDMEKWKLQPLGHQTISQLLYWLCYPGSQFSSIYFLKPWLCTLVHVQYSYILMKFSIIFTVYHVNITFSQIWLFCCCLSIKNPHITLYQNILWHRYAFVSYKFFTSEVPNWITFK